MENRRYSRVEVGMGLVLTTDDGVPRDARLIDISISGAYLVTSPPVAKGDQCKIELNLDEHVSIRFAGEVVRTDGPEESAGVRMVSIDVESLQHLLNLVALNNGRADRVKSELYDEAFDQPFK